MDLPVWVLYGFLRTHHIDSHELRRQPFGRLPVLTASDTVFLDWGDLGLHGDALNHFSDGHPKAQMRDHFGE